MTEQFGDNAPHLGAPDAEMKGEFWQVVGNHAGELDLNGSQGFVWLDPAGVFVVTKFEPVVTADGGNGYIQTEYSFMMGADIQKFVSDCTEEEMRRSAAGIRRRLEEINDKTIKPAAYDHDLGVTLNALSEQDESRAFAVAQEFQREADDEAAIGLSRPDAIEIRELLDDIKGATSPQQAGPQE